MAQKQNSIGQADDDRERDPLLPNPETKRRPFSRRRGWLFATVAGVLLLVASAVATAIIAGQPVGPLPYQGRLVTGSRAAVAVEAEECSNAGLEILKIGGNAVDAAIASALCIGVIDSFATGIGGGGFMLIRSPNGSYEFIDFRETAPAASHRDMFVDNPDAAKYGGLSVAVPGEVRGFEMAHRRHGSLPWSVLFEPAVRIARDGFKTTRLLEQRLEVSKDWLLLLPEWRADFAPNGTLVREGDIIRRPNLANTLETIAKEGADAFYTGTIAAHLVNTTQATGGIMTLEDMRSYQPVIRPTVTTYYHGRKVTTCSNPTSGPVLASVLNILEQYNLRVQGFVDINLHRFIEALKFGFAFRTEMGDPDFTKNQERIDEIVTKEWASFVRRNISDDTTHEPLYYNPKYDHVESHGTMHLSVVDENDGAVALTSTVNLGFGSRVMDPATGVILNDEMDDFSIPGKPNAFGLYPSEHNFVEPGKRPLSSITPTIIERDGLFEMAVGASGGSLIPTATLNVIVNTLDYGMDLYTAIDAPRVHHQLMPNIAIFEDGYGTEMLNELSKRGHNILLPHQRGSAVQAVRRLPDRTVHAASDPRKYGLAAAY